ncbi:hypothetical protein Rhopal_007492-T1 [Rhodotorula paludigena]|uniref:FAD-binding FR-type domain-containing protein n=1 Tax=Rhodotorula paludigena TaxID=86838 RepID=A0AAV5GY15_9BASI|nr:hypothetical protein Rhopal_007492-T1 [Rhodotorula paludigena]
MPLWPAHPEPWPDTVEAALALPASWSVSEAFVKLHAGSPDFLYNSFIPARWYNRFLWKAVAVILILGLIRRLISPRFVRRLPPFLRDAHTLYTKHWTLAPLAGTNALFARSPLPNKSGLARWTTVQVPLRPDVLLLSLYAVATALVAFSGYDLPWPNGFYSEPTPHWWPILRHIADRTGVMALGSTPLVFLLAARNSPITWMTGADFGTLQIYHRWVARITYANVFVHMLLYSIIHLEINEWRIESLFDKRYLVLGWVAFFGGWILCFMAWRRLRQIAYELFLVGHIVSALAWVVGAYLHIFFLGGRGASEEYLQLCYLTVGLWGFDRVARRALVLWHNTPLGRTLLRTPRPAGADPSPRRNRLFAADGVLLGASNDFVRLRITPSSPWSSFRGGPGAFVYISCFSPGHRAWESHPFSIAWPLGVPDPSLEPDSAESSLLESPASKSTRLDDLAPILPPSLTPSSSSATTAAEAPFEPHPWDEHASPASFELLVKRYSGFTRSLAESLHVSPSAIPSSAADDPLVLSVSAQAAEEDGTVPLVVSPGLRIAVEGPYGAASSSHPCAMYRHALLVAGGSGLAMVTSQLADLGVRVLRECGEVRCEKVTVVWTVREPETVALIVPYLHRLYRLFIAAPSFVQQRIPSLAPSLSPHSSPPSSPPPADPSLLPLSSEPFLDLHIYITAPSPSSSSSSSSARDPALSQLDSLASHLPPEFCTLTTHPASGRPDIASFLDALSAQEEELLVVSCGPAALCDSTREAVRSRLGVGGGRRRRRGGKEKRWEACRLVYSEEAVVW